MRYQLLPPLSQDEYSRLEASVLHDETCTIEVDENDNILDGHHRFDICKKHNIPFEKITRTFSNEFEKIAYVIKVNDARRQMSSEQRVEIRKKQIEIARELDKLGYTQEEIGGVLGVPRRTISDWLRNINGGGSTKAYITEYQTRQEIKQKEEQAIIELLESGLTQEQVASEFKITQPRVSQIKKRHDKKQEKIKERVSELKATDDNILLGTLQDLGENVADNSIDLVFTDPPYGKEAVRDYEVLGRFAARTLKDGASLLVYSGQSVLPEVYATLTKHLTYWWTICMEHGGQNQRLAGKFVYIEWKPIIWLVKSTRRDSHFVSDYIKSEQDKNHHEWGQGIKEASYYIEQLTYENELVCDPFLGGATTILAAKKLNRRYLGFEKDEELYRKIVSEMS